MSHAEYPDLSNGQLEVGGGAESPTWPSLPSALSAAPPCAFLLFCLVVGLGPQVARMGTATLLYERSKDDPQRSPRGGLLVGAAFQSLLGASGLVFRPHPHEYIHAGWGGALVFL